MTKGAQFNRGDSEQSVTTPPEFLAAVLYRFGRLDFDLAADENNCQCGRFFGKEDNSLIQAWHLLPGNLWLNPPYANIAPWAARCAERMHDSRWTLMLVPASVGAKWFRQYVAPCSMVLELAPRLTFVGSAQCYPKDLILAAYGFGCVSRQPWDWKAKQ